MLIFTFVLNTLDDADKYFVESIYHTYKKKILYTAKVILNNDDDSDDALEETMLRVIRYREQLMKCDKQSLKKYIIIYTKSVCYDMIRKKSRQNVTMSDYTENDNGETQDMDVADDIDLLRDFINNETIGVLVNAINTLESPAREIILCKYDMEMKNTEIAKLFNMNASTVSTILSRTRAKLYKIMEEYDNGRA